MKDEPTPEYVRYHRSAVQGLARELRIVRLEQGLSQERVAFEAGIAVPTYANLERCYPWSARLDNPTLDTLLRVFRALGVTPPSIVDG